MTTPPRLDLASLLKSATPFLDLRSPGEFAAGAVPDAVNLPLLTDAERQQVGLTYRQRGQAAALALGHELVSGQIRNIRIQGWRDWADRYPHGWLYCWRGGMRSEIAQRWLAEAGVEVPRVAGGFKALRQCCLELLAEAPDARPWLVIGGRTGCGKTRLLAEIPGSIDLEGLANHRGSAFGGRPDGQPTPVQFENALAVTYLQSSAARVILEDESRTIGRLALPQTWHARMQRAPLVLLDGDLETRAMSIQREYVWEPLGEGIAASALISRYRAALNRIRKRLGGLRTNEVESLLIRGFDNGDQLPWIRRLLEWYYDPMYDYQLKDKQDRVVFSGAMDAVREFMAAGEDDRDRAGGSAGH